MTALPYLIGAASSALFYGLGYAYRGMVERHLASIPDETVAPRHPAEVHLGLPPLSPLRQGSFVVTPPPPGFDPGPGPQMPSSGGWPCIVCQGNASRCAAVTKPGEICSYLRGKAAARSQEIDRPMVPQLRDCPYAHPVGTRCPNCAKWPYPKQEGGNVR